MKRLIALTLTAALLATPTLAAGAEDYSDVKSSDWFAPYVGVCVEEGLMNGTGGGQFSPLRELSQGECLTLAMRLHQLRHGGDGVLPDAPEAWGLISLTTEDGTESQGYLSWQSNQQGVGFFLCYPGKANPHTLALWVGDAQREWAQRMDRATASVTVDGADYTGRVYFLDLTDRTYLYFIPNGTEEDRSGSQLSEDDAQVYYELGRRLADLERYCPAPEEGTWLRNACCYAVNSGVNLPTGDFQPRVGMYPADRLRFALLLAQAAGELEAINPVTTIPDLEPDVFHSLYTQPEELEGVYGLYRAGILNGVDAAGNFDPHKPLSRSEAAAMVSRVVREDLRLSAQAAPEQTTPEATPEQTAPQDAQQAAPGDDAAFVRAYLGDKADQVYFTLGGLSVQAGDFLSAALDAVRQLQAACREQGMSFDWTHTIDGVDFLTYAYQQANTVALGRAWESTRPELDLSGFDNWAQSHWKAKHILVEDQVTANTLYDFLQKDPSQFDALLSVYGTDPGMEANPGGYVFGAGEMVESFENGVKALQPGEIGAPVQSSFGWHVIQRLPLTQTDYEQTATDLAWTAFLQENGQLQFAAGFDDGMDLEAAYEAWMAYNKGGQS